MRFKILPVLAGGLTLEVLLLFAVYSARKHVSTDMQATRGDVDLSDYMNLWLLLAEAKSIWMQDVATSRMNGQSEKTKKINIEYISLKNSLEKSMQVTEVERKYQLSKLSDYVFEKIDALQHPENCSNERLLVCEIRIKCGFGCYTHTLVNCMLKALDSGRVAVYRPKDWKYTEKGMEYAFLPLAKCSNSAEFHMIPLLEKSSYHERVVRPKVSDEPYLPWNIPTQLSKSLFHLHGDPYAWWLGQFVSYALRPLPWLQEKFERKKKELNFRGPIAGIHVRRGDKVGKIAQSFPIEQYMTYVDLWYDQIELDQPDVQRRLYVATEDHTVLPKLLKKYPRYTLIMYQHRQKTAEESERWGPEALESIVMDIHFLSMCDYLVCTLSSNVCRVAYELMMNLRSDASTRIQSIDIPYKFKWVWERNWTAVRSHEGNTSNREIELRPGDKISVQLDGHLRYNDGFTTGKNFRTQKSGIFPSYKARPDVLLHSFSVFENDRRENG